MLHKLLAFLFVPIFAQMWPNPGPGHAPAVGGGLPAWFDSIDFSTTDTNVSQSDNGLCYSVPITISSSGNVTKLRVGFGTVAADSNFKIALYDNSGNLVVGPSQVAVHTTDSNTEIEVATSTTAVSSGNFMVAFRIFDASDDFKGKSSTSGTSTYDHPSYASFPPATLTSPFATTLTVSAGAYVQ